MSTQPTAVIYLRVSTKEQAVGGGDGEGFSIPAQREACMRKAESLGAAVIDEFVDRGESARSSARPELQRMLGYLTETPTTYVIVHKIDRLARNRADDVEINLVIQNSGSTLVSCTESIDETPSGILLHGIMSSIAEFYSSNLANEVKKGSLQKAKSGGTVSRAPTGYLNVRKMQDGREIRTIEVDPVRGPLMACAFERYAKGDINLRDLLTEMTERGLDSKPGPKTPSKPLRLGHFHRLLTHPYYKGLVRYKGVTYPGNHEPLVSEATWQKVQDTLQARGRSGEKDRKHPHYLKGTVFCGDCGSRLLVSNNRGKSGKIYPYFICLGRQQKTTNCAQKAVLIETVESLVAQHYERVQPTSKLLDQLRDLILDEMQLQKAAADQEHETQTKRKQRLLDEQAKLLQAHYADAIPLDLMKSEQQRIENELTCTDERLRATAIRFEEVEANLNRALSLANEWASAYRSGGPTIRRQMNQSIFKKINVDDEGGVTSEFSEPFELLLSEEVVEAARDHAEVREAEPSFIEQQLNKLAAEWRQEKELVGAAAGNYKTPPQKRRGLNYDILVGVEGLEPPTLSV